MMVMIATPSLCLRVNEKRCHNIALQWEGAMLGVVWLLLGKEGAIMNECLPF